MTTEGKLTRIIPISEIFNTRQRNVWEKLNIYTLNDLAKYMKNHYPFFLKGLYDISDRSIALAVMALYDHGIEIPDAKAKVEFDEWYCDYTTKDPKGKSWLKKTKKAKARDEFFYGVAGQNIEAIKKSNADRSESSAEQKLVAAKKFVIALMNSGIPFDPVKACRECEIEFNSQRHASYIAGKYWRTVNEAGLLEECQLEAGIDLQMGFNEALSSLRELQGAERIEWVNFNLRCPVKSCKALINEAECPECGHVVKLGKKIPVAMDVNMVRVKAAAEFAKLYGGVAKKKMAKEDEMPKSPEEARQALVEAAARILKVSNWSLAEFTEAVKIKLAS